MTNMQIAAFTLDNSSAVRSKSPGDNSILAGIIDYLRVVEALELSYTKSRIAPSNKKMDAFCKVFRLSLLPGDSEDVILNRAECSGTTIPRQSDRIISRPKDFS